MRTLTTLLGMLLLTFGTVAIAQDQEGDGGEGQDGQVVEVKMITDGDAYYFEPAGLVVEPGTTIRFVNESGTHGSSSYSSDNDKPQRIPEGAEGWSSPIFAEAGQSFEVTLEQEGVYDYYCPPHEMLGMVGRIIVGDPQASPAADTSDLQPAVAEAFPSVDAIMNDDDGRLTYEEQQNASE